jgi:hypothetical protein
MKSEKNSIENYLDNLPSDRREILQTVRDVILENLPEGYEESFNWGMISYQVPLIIFPDTYNKQPLMYAALAAQKNHYAVYLMGIYADQTKLGEFEQAYKATGKRYDVGKSCVRFRKLDDLPLDVVGEAIASIEVTEYVDMVKKAHSLRKPGKSTQ